jgi:hypothetical protein
MRRVDGERRHQGEDVRAVVVAERLPLLGRQIVVGADVDVVGGELLEQLRQHLALQAILLADLRVALDDLLRGRAAVDGELVHVGGDLLLQAADALHDELVHVRRGDGEELDALEQPVRSRLRFEQHAAVERQPGELPIEEHPGGKLSPSGATADVAASSIAGVVASAVTGSGHDQICRGRVVREIHAASLGEVPFCTTGRDRPTTPEEPREPHCNETLVFLGPDGVSRRPMIRTVRVRTLLVIQIVACLTSSIAAADDAAKARRCEATKLAAVGRYDACRANARARAVTKQSTPSYARCDGQLEKKWQKAEKSAGGACPTTGDLASVRLASTRHGALIASELERVQSSGPCAGVSFAYSYMITNRKTPFATDFSEILPAAPGALSFFTAAGAYQTSNPQQSFEEVTQDVFLTRLKADLALASSGGKLHLGLYVTGSATSSRTRSPRWETSAAHSPRPGRGPGS